MAQPTQYNRTVDFTERDGDNTNHAALNAEFDAVETTVDQLCHNLALIQQDDGNLRRGIVGADELAPSAFERVLGSVNEAVLSADAAANAAMQEAAAAKQSAGNAATQAGAAASHAAAASGSEANARQSATDAAQSVATAGGIAEQVARDVVSTVVSQVEQARTAAQQAATNAAQAQQLAQQAANSASGALSVSAGDARYVPKSHLADSDPHSQYLLREDAKQVAGEVIDARLDGGTWHLNDRSRDIQGVDLNTVVEPGVYRYLAGNAANANAPADGPQWGVLEGIRSHGFVTQIIYALYNVGDGVVWARSWDARSSNIPGVSGWRRLNGDWLPRVHPVLARRNENNWGGHIEFEAAPNQPYGSLNTDYAGGEYRIYVNNKAGSILGGVYLPLSRLTGGVQPVLADAPVTFTGAAPVYGARSWGSFTYAGAFSVSLHGLGNVSSVTAPSNGVVTVNFITPMPDAAYAVVLHAHGQPDAQVSSRIAGGFTISGLASAATINFAVFR